MTARRLWIAMLVLALVGVGVAAYLTYVHYAGVKPACTAGETCTKVQTSVYSKVAGVPVALIGLIGYVAILISLLVPQGESARLVTMVLAIGGFAFSVYLTYRELFSIHAVCEWCASSAVIMTLLAALAAWRFLTADPGSTRADPAAPGRSRGEPPQRLASPTS